MAELDTHLLNQVISIIALVVSLWSVAVVVVQVRSLERREKKSSEKIFKSATNAIKSRPHETR